MTTKRMLVLVGCVAACVLPTVGCVSGNPGRYDLSFSVDETVRRNVSVQLDVVGVNDTDLEKWQRIRNVETVDAYFPSSPLRSDADKRTFTFVQESAPVQTLPVNDPMWQNWESTRSTHLFLLVDLVGGFSPPDPRVLMLPLAQNRWPKPYRKGFMSKREPIEIKVESSGIRCLTPPLPPKR